MIVAASERAEEIHWRSRLADAPHGAAWFSSLHASSFPSDDPRACERLLAYKLLGVPEKEPFSRMLRGTMIEGQAIEDWFVGDLDLDGRLLTPPATAEHQLRIEDADHWLTGSPDVIVLPPFWNRPHYIEVKSKDLEVVAQMQAGSRGPDEKHVRQCRAGIGLANRVSQQIWPSVVVCSRTWRLALRGDPNPETGETDDDGAFMCRDHGQPLVPGSCLQRIELQPLRTGSIIYAGRDRPNNTCEYFFEHDGARFQAGLHAVDRVREYFQRNELPPHPFGGKQWSEQPCKFCDLKRDTCKPDHQAGVRRLSETNGAAWARSVYGSYDVDEIIAAVTERWRGRSGVVAVMPKQRPSAA
jgi:hypothetical protein